MNVDKCADMPDGGGVKQRYFEENIYIDKKST